MKKYLQYILLFISGINIALLSSCHKDHYSGQNLTFSTDTIFFDTIFTRIGSVTKSFKVYNHSGDDITLKSIYLAGGNTSNFRLNIDGQIGNMRRDINLRAGDSLYIFVEVTIDPFNSNNPMVIEDSVMFTDENKMSDVKLVAWGQDMNLFFFNEIKNSLTWSSKKPYLIYGNLVIDSLATLFVSPGTKVCLHKYCSIVVQGSLHINGTKSDPVRFQGDRSDDLVEGISYNDIEGQWGTIAFLSGSKNNIINYAIIKNSIAGMQLNQPQYQNPAEVEINNTIIDNASLYGILTYGSTIKAVNTIISNCGNFALNILNGGNYEFIHCTIANYYDSHFGIRDVPSILLSNYYYGYIEEGNQYVLKRFENDLTNAYFGNCIIYGTLKQELGLADTSSNLFNYKFDHCLIKLPDEYNISDTAHFQDVIIKADSLFADVKKKNFQLDTLSAAQDKGSIVIARRHPADYNGNDRTLDGKPDLGAYEKIDK